MRGMLLTVNVALLMVAAISVWAQERKPVEPAALVLNVPWVGQAPKIDGKPDDAIWQFAPKGGDFYVYKTAARPREQTEFQVCYDTEALYLLVTCHESQMAGLKTQTNQEMRDMTGVFSDDSLEVFIAPQDARGTPYFQLVTSARGIRWDGGWSTAGLGAAWNGAWEEQTWHGAEAWYAEFKVPHRILVSPGEFVHSPRPGDRWTFMVCRNQARLREQSAWSFLNTGWHQIQRYGQLIFQALTEPRPTAEISKIGDLALGHNQASFTLSNTTGDAVDVTASLRVVRDGQEMSKAGTSISLPAGAKQELPLDYVIHTGGSQQAEVTVYWGPRLLVSGTAWFVAPEVDKQVEESVRWVQDGVHRLTATPGASSALQRVGERLQARAGEINGRWNRRLQLTASGWEDLVRDAARLYSDAKDFRARSIRETLRVQTQKQIPEARFAVAPVSVFERASRDYLYLGRPQAPLEVSAARNEWENVQLVIVPFRGAVTDLSLMVSDLTDGKGHVIAGSNVTWRPVGHIYAQDPATYTGSERNEWPDPLLPQQAFTAQREEATFVWLEIYVPKDAASGDYRGTVSVIGLQGPPVRLPLQLKVWDFVLPDKNSLPNYEYDIVFSWERFYGHEPSLEELDAICAFQERYRLNPCAGDTYSMVPKVIIYKEKDGKYTFDFSELGKRLELAVKHGATALNINFSCGQSWTMGFDGMWGYPWFKLIDRETGKVSDYPPKELWGRGWEVVFKDPLFQQCMRDWWAYVQSKGWGSMAYWESVDEPNDESRIRQLQVEHSALQGLMPGLRLLSWGVVPSRPGTEGYLHIYGPAAVYLDEATLRDCHEQQAQGREFWTYLCAPAFTREDGGESIGVTARDRALGLRVYFWETWRDKSQGWNVYALGGFHYNTAQMRKPPEQRWPNVPWIDPSLGLSNQCYPGPDQELLPSIRLEHMRDGVEDYEYLVVLRKALQDLETKSADSPLLDQGEVLLNVGPEIYAGPLKWTHDPGVLLTRRAQVAAMIEKVQAASR